MDIDKLPKNLTKKQFECVQAYYSCNSSERFTAKELGIGITSVRKHLWLAHKKGVNFAADTFCEHAPAGFEMTHGTLHVKGGEVVQSWPRIRPTLENEKSLFEYLRERVPVSPVKLKPVTNCNPDIQLEITLADLHYGQLSWNKETRGGDYDMNIARELIKGTMAEVYSRVDKVEETVLILMGDNFHTDFFSGLTEGHGHTLDTDSRYPKMIFTGVETFLSAIETCKRFSKRVRVIIIYGNHDKQTSVCLQSILYFHYLDRPGAEGITIEMSPAKHQYNIWGISATEYTHGEGTNKFRLTSDIVQHVATNDIIGVREFYAKQGHLHREHVEDVNGVTFEIVPSPTAKDAYASHSHYKAKRAVVATTYHKKFGELNRFKVTPRCLEAMKESSAQLATK